MEIKTEEERDDRKDAGIHNSRELWGGWTDYHTLHNSRSFQLERSQESERRNVQRPPAATYLMYLRADNLTGSYLAKYRIGSHQTNGWQASTRSLTDENSTPRADIIVTSDTYYDEIHPVRVSIT
ncbi:hypothetical protein J6590_010143 [Homalodisca vitripennis]|nr:hypothetical protein J6590_010143 [Homalodisca vitripennis]